MSEQTQAANGQEREVWGSRIGLASTIGMAFGLGAIWRFPYVAASGGGAFVLAYNCYYCHCTLPAGWAEIAFCPQNAQWPITAFQKVLGKKVKLPGFSRSFRWGLNMYYLVVVSWTLAYTIFSLYCGQDFMAIPSVSSSPLRETDWLSWLDRGYVADLMVLQVVVGLTGDAISVTSVEHLAGSLEHYRANRKYG